MRTLKEIRDSKTNSKTNNTNIFTDTLIDYSGLDENYIKDVKEYHESFVKPTIKSVLNRNNK